MCPASHVSAPSGWATISAVTYLLATLAAACYGVNWVLQQHEAARAPDLELSPARLLVVVSRRPLWLLGLGALIAGSVLQAAALAEGSLGVVEPLLVLSLPFALGLGVPLSKQDVRHREWIGALVVCAGLALLLVVGAPTKTNSDGSTPAWLLVGLPTVGAVVLLLVVAWRTDDAVRAVMFATAAAICFGIVDALSKAMFVVAEHGLLRVVSTWEVYALVATALAALALSQSAFQAAPLRVSLPSLAVVEPIVGVAFGVWVLDGSFSHDVADVVAEVVAAVAIVAGSLPLARSRVITGD